MGWAPQAAVLFYELTVFLSHNKSVFFMMHVVVVPLTAELTLYIHFQISGVKILQYMVHFFVELYG
jgi:hypothetical protein